MPWIRQHRYHRLLAEAFFGRHALDTLLDMKAQVARMASREDAAHARFGELIGQIRDLMLAKDAEINTLRAALHNADQMAAQRVDAALQEDSNHDADRIEQGNLALEEMIQRATQGGDTVPPFEPVPGTGGTVASQPSTEHTDPAPIHDPADPADPAQDEGEILNPDTVDRP